MNNLGFREFYRFLKPYRVVVFVLLVFQLVNIACSVSIPYVLGELIHLLEIRQISYGILLSFFLGLSLIYLIWNSTKVIVDISFEKINKGVENDLRSYCFDKIINSPTSRIQSQSEGEIINKVIRDTEKVEKAFSSMFQLYDLIVNSIGIAVMILVVNFLLGSIILVLFLLIIMLHKWMSKPLKELYIRFKDSEESILREFKNQLSGLLTIKVFSLEDTSKDILESSNKDNYKSHMVLNRKVSIIKNINFFTTSIFRIASVIIGGALYLMEKLNIGQIFAIHTYTIQLSASLRSIIELDIILKDIRISFDRVMGMMEEYSTKDSENHIELNGIKNIDFDDVNFQYESKYIIKNLSFNVSKNEIIGIKGQNGSGKTTLTYLICGFYKANGVNINGIDINKLREVDIIKYISYALQDVHLFPSTIMDNLTCFKDMCSDDVFTVCKDIGLHDKIMSFENGYQTLVNEKNLNLSGGEKQLISLARALIKKSDVIILDEINSSLDIKTEKFLFDNISKYFKGKIVFIISHKDSVFDICDRVIDLDLSDGVFDFSVG